ncbi:MAG: Phospho-N-acetylmuramoyl-pentapeptide-transferase [Parcubacteria group bacterium LiPW_15]|nr:MAG: Phospho-N-acetylmuramoyl-pentapeptide-transferase [Parcubacteria group bacterium LiPW_15]
MILEQAIRIILLATAGFVVALIFTPIWLKFLGKIGFGKQIRTSEEAPVYSALHSKKEGTPNGGGVIIWGTVVFLAILFFILHYFFDGFWKDFNFINRAETYLPLAALIIAGIIGLLDDWMGARRIGGGKGGGLKVRHKLFLYFLISLVGAWWFYFKLEFNTLNVPFLGAISIGPWYIPLFMFVIIATAFSANETDGLDGLLGGVSLFAFISFAAVAFVLGRYDLAAFAAVLVGSLLAFLWFNIYPARFFMGDTGSMALGITMGIIAMLTNTTLLLPLFGLILVVESLSVITQLISKKLRNGKKIFLSSPIHHHFEAIGWHESRITMRFWIISAIASALGLVIFFLTRG